MCFFFNDPVPTKIYTLSLHDALPIYLRVGGWGYVEMGYPRPGSLVCRSARHCGRFRSDRDRKSTRLNSSHQIISYAVFCLKKKTTKDLAREPVCPRSVIMPSDRVLSH